ncbi:MAG: hypothetical protein JNL19_00610 [Burkholderiales bacterium]|nr:hypothetical protein [Burkholderiales bacterium]
MLSPAPSAELTLRAALAAEAQGDGAAALTHYRALLNLIPDHPGALLRLAQAVRADDPAIAIHHLQRAVQGARRLGLRADAAPLFAELATLERAQARTTDALATVRSGLAQCGDIAGLVWEECECLRELGRSAERAARLNRLAALQPNDAAVLAELGLALIHTPSAAQAVRPLRAALALGLQDADLSLALANLEIRVGDFAQAEPRLRALLKMRPDDLGALAKLWHLLRIACRWSEAAPVQQAMLERIAAGEVHPALSPFTLLGCEMSPALLRDYAERHGRHVDAAVAARPPHVRAVARTGPLRVGYLSSDFHDHATAILMAGLFEAHDPKRIEAYAYSYGPTGDSTYRARLQRAIPNWHEVSALSDAEVAARIEADGIDVLVELKGLTYGERLGIVALRPAPVIVHYLGYPGTLARQGVEFLVSDAIVSPPDSDTLYNETLLRLPRCYQANDRRRLRPAPTPRAALGLPAQALVLCNFNQSFKWSEPWFRVWLRAIAAQDDAVLWLLDPGASARAALAPLIAEHGVTARVLWAPRVPPAEHLARLPAADLALDQLPCASHTTGADALWMGVPMLTCLGDGYHGRVGASLLAAVGLNELITDSIEAYANRLHALLLDRARLRDYRQHLADPRMLDLFDTAAFTQDWENLLLDTFARAVEAGAPDPAA